MYYIQFIDIKTLKHLKDKLKVVEKFAKKQYKIITQKSHFAKQIILQHTVEQISL